jgi:ribose transport system permease protein
MLDQSPGPNPTDPSVQRDASAARAATEGAGDAVAPRRLPKSRLERLQPHALLAAWVVIAAVFTIAEPGTFATLANVRTIFGTQSVLLVLAIALLLPLIVGEFDLSIAPTLGFSSMLLAVLNVKHGWALAPAIVVSLAAGLLIGTANGFLVVKIGVNAFIATLGVGTVVTGITYAVSNYEIVSGISSSLVSAMTTEFLGIQVSFYYALALVVILWYILRFTPLGRHMLFAGDNPEAARLCGLPVSRIRMGAFVWCGLLSAAAGIVLAGVLGSADPNGASAYLLPAYAAAFLGSTAVVPGQFNAWGTAIAVYFLITGITGLQLLGLEDWIQYVFYGFSLVVAVTLSHLATRRAAA